MARGCRPHRMQRCITTKYLSQCTLLAAASLAPITSTNTQCLPSALLLLLLFCCCRQRITSAVLPSAAASPNLAVSAAARRCRRHPAGSMAHRPHPQHRLRLLVHQHATPSGSPSSINSAGTLQSGLGTPAASPTKSAGYKTAGAQQQQDLQLGGGGSNPQWWLLVRHAASMNLGAVPCR